MFLRIGSQEVGPLTVPLKSLNAAVWWKVICGVFGLKISRGAPQARGRAPLKWPKRVRHARTFQPYASKSAKRSSYVLASSTGLSWRQRLILGNRSATPDLCRGDAWMPSNAISNTCSGFT